MVDAHTIATPDGSATVYGPLPPSKHGACVTRLIQPTEFHGLLTFSALFLDAVVHCRGQRGGRFVFTVPRRQAFAAVTMLHLVRNELLHRLHHDVPFNFVEAAIDSTACHINLLDATPISTHAADAATFGRGYAPPYRQINPEGRGFNSERKIDVPFNFVEATIDGMSCRIDLLDATSGWFRVSLTTGNKPLIEDLNIFGLESLDDFASGWLRYWGAS